MQWRMATERRQTWRMERRGSDGEEDDELDGRRGSREVGDLTRDSRSSGQSSAHSCYRIICCTRAQARESRRLAGAVMRTYLNMVFYNTVGGE